MERKSRLADPWKALLLPAIIVIGALACYLYFNKGITEYREGHENGYSAGYDDGYAEGHDEGYAEGYDKGHDVSYQDGYNKGYDEGYNAGKEDGYDSGYGFGRRDAIESYAGTNADSNTKTIPDTSSAAAWTPPADRWVPSWVDPDKIVYVSNKSHTIHDSPYCSGMKNYFEMTFQDAVDAGYSFCLNCW